MALLKGFTSKNGIIGSSNLIDGVNTVAELFDMQVMTYKIQREQDAEHAIHDAVKENVQMIDGDVITVSIVRGLAYRLFSSLLAKKQSVKRYLMS